MTKHSGAKIMRKAAWAVAFILAAALTARAEDEYDIKVYPCPRVEEGISIDGRLDEAAWSRAVLVGGFTFYDRPEAVDPQAYFRMLHDADGLYVGVTSDEPLMRKVVAVPQARDAHAVFSGETIEFFLDPKHDHADYYQFAVNIAGSIYDSRRTDPTWSAGVKAATQQGEDHWTLEFAIPWKDVGLSPAAGAVLGFNMCRDRLVGADKLWCNWSQTKANFHDPERFAHLVLAPTADDLGKLGAEFRKGGRTGPIVVYSEEGFAQTTYTALAAQSLKRVDELLGQVDARRTAETDEKTKQELGKLLATYRDELTPIRKALSGTAKLDAREWSRMDLRIHQLIAQLDEAIWRARLEALLSQI